MTDFIGHSPRVQWVDVLVLAGKVHARDSCQVNVIIAQLSGVQPHVLIK